MAGNVAGNGRAMGGQWAGNVKRRVACRPDTQAGQEIVQPVSSGRREERSAILTMACWSAQTRPASVNSQGEAGPSCLSPGRDGAKRTARGRYAWRDDKTSLKRMPTYSEHADIEMLPSDRRPRVILFSRFRLGINK